MANNNFQPYEPEKCWVGDSHKICFPDEETAEMSARLTETEHGLASNTLSVYKCEYGNHWHFTRRKH